jgi:hypothetical protein
MSFIANVPDASYLQFRQHLIVRSINMRFVRNVEQTNDNQHYFRINHLECIKILSNINHCKEIFKEFTSQ